MNKNLLLTIEEYEALPGTIKGQVPYIYSLDKDGQSLFYFGAKHVMDPKHPEIEFLHEQWLNFLKDKPKEKTVVIYEGNVNEKGLTTLEEAVKNYGESGAIVFWANQANVQSVRPEPKIEDEANELLKKFSKEEIFYFYMIRGVATWQRKVDPEDFNDFILRNAKRYKEALGWEDFNFAFDPTVLEVHRKIFGKEFDLSDTDFIRNISIPIGNLSVITDIARMSSLGRNFAILDSIGKFWEEGKNIFVVYGASHAIMQERAIRNMVEA
ncbi:hypothetical protein D4R99_02585 [bacterium]|nr:MAG: hypothetical protein D4R99_02585 [bacterium]